MVDHPKTLAKLADEYRRATKAMEKARQALVDGVRAADQDGIRQVDIIKATDHVWTREQVRRVVAERS